MNYCLAARYLGYFVEDNNVQHTGRGTACCDGDQTMEAT